MAEEAFPANEPWSNFDLRDLKKYYNEFSKEHTGKKLIKIIANKLRRGEDEVYKKLEECLPKWAVSSSLKQVVVPLKADGDKNGVGVVIDDTSVLEADNKNLKAMVALLEKELQASQKKIHELSNNKIALDPKQNVFCCPECKVYFAVQKVIP